MAAMVSNSVSTGSSPVGPVHLEQSGDISPFSQSYQAQHHPSDPEGERANSEGWPGLGTVSDPEVEGGCERIAGMRKKTVRWKMDSPPSDGLSSENHPLPSRRRRTRSFSGDELSNAKPPSSWDSNPADGSDRPRAPALQPAPLVVLDLPTLEGGWQTRPYSPSSGVPTILKRPTIEEISPQPTEPVPTSTSSVLPKSGIAASNEAHQEPPLSLTATHPVPPPDESLALVKPVAEHIPAETHTAPSSPLFPPLPTPASSFATTMPKFTPPLNLVPSPKVSTSRTLAKDRPSDPASSPRISSSLEPHKHLQQNQDIASKAQSSPSRHSRPSSTSHHTTQQARTISRRQLHPTSSVTYSPVVSSQTTQPSPPNPVSLTASPRSPAGHSLSPHTPQSTTISPTPLPSISIADDGDFSVSTRPESPPWQTVGSSASISSPRLKNNTPWRTEVINSSVTSLIRSPPVTPFTSVHLQIDELPNEGESDHESLRPPSERPSLTTVPLTPVSVASETPLRPDILSPSPPKLADLQPSTPPFKPDDPILEESEIDSILQDAYMPWPIRVREEAGILPVRKIVKRTEKGEWDGIVGPDDIPRESAHWRLVRAQRLWLKGNLEFFKLKHPSGLPQDHKSPKLQYVDDGEPLRAVELLVESVLLDPRVLSWKSSEAKRDFMEQLAWQFFSDSRHTGWPELSNIDHNLDVMFAKAQHGSKAKDNFVHPGVISTRRALASFIRNHVILAMIEEADGFTQAAILRYGRALDIIDWVNEHLGFTPEKSLYGKGGAKQRIETVYDAVFGRGVQIRHGVTLIAQYKFIKKNPRCSHLRVQILQELLEAAGNLFASFEAKPLSPYVKTDLTLDVYVSDYVYHVAYAFFFRGFYARENAKIILDNGQPSPVGGTSAAEIARNRSKSSAQALAQAALLFPEDEEERIECLEMALEEILKVGGLRVGEARAMYRSLKEAKASTDKLWNCVKQEEDDEGEDITLGLFDDGAATTKKKKKKKKKAKKDAADTADTTLGDGPAIAKEPIAPKNASPSSLLSHPPGQTPRTVSTASAPHPPTLLLFLESWFTALERNLDSKRIMSGDVLHPAHDLRGRPEVVWEEVVEDGGEIDDGDSTSNLPWASWGMKSVKATKWEDLLEEHNAKTGARSATRKEKCTIGTTHPPHMSTTSATREKATPLETASTPKYSPSTLIKLAPSDGSPRKSSDTVRSIEIKPAAQHWERPTPWAVIARISKEKFFSINLDVFEGNEVKK